MCKSYYNMHVKCTQNFLLFFRAWRIACYRQFTYWIHQKLGRKVSRIVPACVTKIIHETFRSQDRQYRGFMFADM